MEGPLRVNAGSTQGHETPRCRWRNWGHCLQGTASLGPGDKLSVDRYAMIAIDNFFTNFLAIKGQIINPLINNIIITKSSGEIGERDVISMKIW